MEWWKWVAPIVSRLVVFRWNDSSHEGVWAFSLFTPNLEPTCNQPATNLELSSCLTSKSPESVCDLANEKIVCCSQDQRSTKRLHHSVVNLWWCPLFFSVVIKVLYFYCFLLTTCKQRENFEESYNKSNNRRYFWEKIITEDANLSLKLNHSQLSERPMEIIHHQSLAVVSV